MEDVAQGAGVSRALVSLAYRDLPGVSAATQARILQVGEALGYVHNRVAARLAGKGGDAIGIFLQDLHNDLSADIYDGLREAAEASQKNLVLAVGQLDGSRDSSTLATLRQSRVDVIIAIGLQLNDSEVQRLATQVPIVCVTRAVSDLDCVVSDDKEGAIMATNHLIELGHSRIVFLSNPPADGYLDRGLGYREAMSKAGLEPRAVETSYSRAEVADIAGRLLDSADPPTALFAHNDLAALGVLDAIVVRGLAPGRDVSVVGYDNSSIGRFPGTALTTVDVDGERLGRCGAELAIRRLADPDAPVKLVSSRPSLVVRGTTGNLRAG